LSCVLAGAMATAVAQEPAAKTENNSPPAEKTGPQAEKSTQASEKAAPAKAAESSAAGQKPAAAKTEEKASLPFQIELLETHVQFEANGDSRKEVHTIVKINDATGARQFARLGFDYNRGFQAVEIPLVKIAHANGGTSEILPSAITDAPNPAVEKFPAYQDVRVKSVRILGLQDGDTLEYRVITTTTKPPLAPDFWLEHTFDRSGIVRKEILDLTLHSMPRIHQLKINPETPPSTLFGDIGGIVCATACAYHWERLNEKKAEGNVSAPTEPDVALSTYASWQQLSRSQLAIFFGTALATPTEIETKAKELTKGLTTPEAKSEALYNFVLQKIKMVDLPLVSVGYRTRNPVDILSSGYATPADKFALFAALSEIPVGLATAGLISAAADLGKVGVVQPTLFDHLVTLVQTPGADSWLDLGLDVAPYGYIPAAFRGKRALLLTGGSQELWREVSRELPFAAKQAVEIEARIRVDGELTSKVRYRMRGDNEVLLRGAFHQTPKEKWKEVAGLLALSDGFRGEITKVTASDPMETKDPFTVEYEITQPNFVDWSKKPVRMPALLPQIALPDAPGKGAASDGGGKIELGTPLEVETRLTLKLPEGTTVQTPPGTSVARDYATCASKYDGHLNTLTATRHVQFLMREIPAERAADYAAFVRAVQLDQAQVISLFPEEKKEKK